MVKIKMGKVVEGVKVKCYTISGSMLILPEFMQKTEDYVERIWQHVELEKQENEMIVNDSNITVIMVTWWISH